MKLSLILLSNVMIVFGQMLQGPTHNYNVTSPVNNGPYVAGQILPCTYRLLSNVDTNGLDLAITLQAIGGFTVPTPSNNTTNSTNIENNNGTYIISEKADISRTDAFFKQEGNLTYFEHSINFNIPTTVKAGNYKVLFTDHSTNTNLQIPIEIRPAAPTPSPANGASPSVGPNHSPGSIFTADANSNFSFSFTLFFVCSLLSFVL
ncbi:uncharacterized protein BX664DRAFT_337091 [Halteromyces radiatus]|uniref:uncharacterized protein n=1 Tax=Halteromyces radiatus TaxID=101107 RepID=UPI00221F0C40|nr:uncharacterized protein BX664DRAFT_337091 [Halteromyces radiatus]KAI8084482.1 hypothetical protein BX664DRAFT_337091 [Halteromyces radiatus]